MKVKHFYFLTILLTFYINPSSLFAQAGYVDTSYYKGKGVEFKCTGGLVQPDSSVIIIGKFAFVNERFINCIAKLNQQGENDYSFNVGTGADEHINQIVRQPDGKLIIAGDFKTFNGDSVFHIIRLNPDGSRDNTFNMGSGFTTNGTVYSLHLQPDGKILAGGIFISYNGTSANYLVRLNSNGSIDNTFNIGTGFDNTVYSIDKQSDGKYIVAGGFTTVNGDTTHKRIVRLDSNGSIDPTFTSGASFNNIVTRAKLQTDGKVIAVGFFLYYNGDTVNRIIRLNTNGSRDLSYVTGTGFNSNVNDIYIQGNGNLYATGNFVTYKGASSPRIIRIDSLGNKDLTFNPGTGLTLSCNAVFSNYDGKIYVGGTSIAADTFARFRLVRLSTNGKVDHTFFKESKLNNQTYASDVQSNGKAIVVGAFTRYNEVLSNRIVRLNTDGSIDTSFKSGLGANNIIRCVKVQTNNKILIGGDFTSYNGKTINRIARLNTDGTLDTTFIVGTGASASVYTIATDNQGKIYVGGNFVVYAGDSVNRIVRLNNNGTRDNAFVTGTGFNNYIYRIVLQQDGKVLLSGAFTTYKGVSSNRIARLLTDGSFDSGFSIGIGANNIVYAIELADSGRILIGGNFTTYGGVSKVRLAMLNSNGSLYTPFNPNAAGVVYDIKKLGRGYLVAGAFVTVNNGVSKLRIAFIDSSGALSNAFYTGAGLDNTINSIFVDTLQKGVFLSGNFTAVQGKLYSRFARLSNSNIRLTSVATALCPGAIVKVYFEKNGSYNSGNVFTVQLSDSTGSFANPTSIGAKSSSTTGQDSVAVYFPSNLPLSSNYRIRIVASSPEDVSNLSPYITVGSPQQPTIAASGPLTFCAGDSVVLTASEGTTFSWSTGAETQSISVKSSGSYIVTVNNNNCIAASNPIAATSIASPDSSITFEVASLCGSGSVKLSGQAGLNYAWNIGPTSQSITVSQDGVYTLTVTDSTGCKSDSTVNLDLTTFFNTLIYANGPTTICSGSSVVLHSYPGLNSYQWSSGQTTDSIVVTTAGTYKVTVSDGICSKTSSAITVTVNPSPIVTFSLPQDTFCQGASPISLNASPSGGIFSGNGISGSTFNPAGLGNSNAVVSYSVTNGSNCTTTQADTAYVAICTGIDGITGNSISVYPNPATDVIYVNGLESKAYHIEILNALGAVVLTLDIKNTQPIEKLNLKDLAEGQYIINVNNNRFRFTKH